MSNKTPLRIKQPQFTTDFELFFRMSADAMMIFSADGRWVDFNIALEKITGYTREELLQLDAVWRIVHPDDVPELTERLKMVYTRNAETINYEVRIVCKDGTIKIISYDSILDKIKELIYVIGRDVTALRNQEQLTKDTESRLQFFFDNAIDGMCIIENGKFTMLNKAFLRIFGYDDMSEIIGKNIFELVVPSVRERTKEIIETGISGLYNSQIIRKDGTLRNIEVTGKTIRVGENQIRITVLRDLDERQLVLGKIEESEERFKAIFENSSIGIALLGPDGKFLEANNNLLNRLGYAQSELMTMQVSDVLLDNDRDILMNNMASLVKGEIDRTYSERRFVKKNGGITWSKVTLSLVQVPSRSPMILSLIEDIDTQKRSERALIESEEKFRAVYESSPMGILITKTPGHIIDFNPAFQEMMGYDIAEMMGKHVTEFTHPDDISKTNKKLQRLYSGEVNTYSDEKRYIRKDGTFFWAKAVVSVMYRNGDETFTVAIIENIEKKKKTEQALEQKNKELTQINQELEHFAYVASHDLQEPLRTITSFIQILERRYAPKLDNDAQQFMGFVVEGAKRMQNLIHDLLEYSRINRFNTGYEKVDLNEIFNTVNRVLKDKIENNDALVLAETLPVIYGSRLQLTQVFQNLIDNAIKFKAKRRKPEIIISVEDRDDKWELIFRDNGIGISPEYYQRIFVIFQRLHTLEEYSGTGIGLAICKKIIERHGGDIWVESGKLHGAEFHLTVAKNMMVPIG